MESSLRKTLEETLSQQKTWLVTGAAGFIGSHLVEFLLKYNQKVVGLDNFSSGFQANIDAVLAVVGAEKAKNFSMIRGSVVDPEICRVASEGCDYVLHQAAIGSVSRSVEDPAASHAANVTGFLNMVMAANAAKVKRFVFASSSAVYGDDATLPKQESLIGNPLSPYAATKRFDEVYGFLAQSLYGIEVVALRYFNVFGPRQDPNGDYAAVIPKWIEARVNGEICKINGDGETSRDFCFVDNIVLANISAAFAPSEATGKAYNIGLGQKTTLNQLYSVIDEFVNDSSQRSSPQYGEFRIGDIKHSVADVSLAKAGLLYEAVVSVRDGLIKTVEFYKTLSDKKRNENLNSVSVN